MRIDPATNSVARRISTKAAYLRDLAIGEGAIWGVGQCGKINCRYGVLMRFDAETGRRTRPLTRLGANPRAVAAAGGYVWVLGARQLLRIDPATGRLAARGRRATWIGRNAQSLAVGGGRLWITTARRRGQAGPVIGPCRLVGVSVRTGRVVSHRRTLCEPPQTVTFGYGATWMNGEKGLPLTASDMAIGFGHVWAVDVHDRAAAGVRGTYGVASIVGIDPDNGTPIGTVVGSTLVGLPRIAVGAGGVWVANAPTGTITRIDPRTSHIVAGLQPDQRRPGRG